MYVWERRALRMPYLYRFACCNLLNNNLAVQTKASLIELIVGGARSGSGNDAVRLNKLLVVNEDWLRDQENALQEEGSGSRLGDRSQRLQLPQLSAQILLSPLLERQWAIVAESSLLGAAAGALLPTHLYHPMHAHRLLPCNTSAARHNRR